MGLIKVPIINELADPSSFVVKIKIIVSHTRYKLVYAVTPERVYLKLFHPPHIHTVNINSQL